MKNQIIEQIHTEFIAMCDLLSTYNPKIIENEFLLQIEFENLESKEVLQKLTEIEYFDVFIDNESPEFIINKLESTLFTFNMEDLRNKNCRINYSKDLEQDYVNNLDYYFFIPDEAIKFIGQHIFTNSDYKVNFGLYNVPSFETPIFRFIDILNETDYSVNKLIESDTLNKIERLLSNTDQKFNLYNNVFSYMCDYNDDNVNFNKSIVREFYKAFFKLLCYKEIDGNYDIRGKKNITISLDENFTIDNFNEFILLTDFLFNDDKFLEKYIIVKNVFTRYVYDKENFSSIDKKIKEINKTTKYYFEKYVQEDLEDFFKNRDTVFKEAINVSKSINEQNDKINSYINVSLISFLILAISFVFKGVSSINISNLIIANVTLITFSLSFYYYIFKSSKERYITVKNQFLLFLDKMGIILIEEKEELITTYLKHPNSDLKNSLHRIKCLLFFSNIILFTITITTISYYFINK